MIEGRVPNWPMCASVREYKRLLSTNFFLFFIFLCSLNEDSDDVREEKNINFYTIITHYW